MADRDDLLSDFCRITGVDASEAALYLETAGWNYHLAMSNFFEPDDPDDIADESEHPLEEKGERQLPKPSPKPSASARIVTMSSLMQSDERDKSDDEGQAFYAGGSSRSGQQVLGPSKRKGHHIVQDMFRAAKRIGAEVVESSEKSQCSAARIKAFHGTGFTLGAPVGSTDVTTTAEASSEGPQCLDIILRAWRTGFTVDNGPLREYTDVENKAFLDAVCKGEIPRELKHKGGEVSLKIEDHSEEDYAPPREQLTAFSGQGHRLGSPTPCISASTSKSEFQKNEADAIKMLNVDQSQPITILQLRLADGSRLIIRMNRHHTIGDIRRYIVIARPEYSAALFTLMTSYPQVELMDDCASVSEAKVLNSVIVQKLL